MKKLDYTIVFVSEMKRSVAFYRDVLDIPLKFESPHWTEFATDGTTLALHPASAGGRDRPTAGHNAAGTCHLGFMVENLNEFHQKMLAHNVHCIQSPKVVEDVGGPLAIYADPDGLPISVGESRKDK